MQVQYRATFDHTSPLPVTCYRCNAVPLLYQCCTCCRCNTVPFLTKNLPLPVTCCRCNTVSLLTQVLPLPVTYYRCNTVPFLTQVLPSPVTAILGSPLTQLFPLPAWTGAVPRLLWQTISRTCLRVHTMVNEHCGCRNWGPRAVPDCLVFRLAWSRSEYSFACFTRCQSSSPLVFVFNLPLFFPILFH